VRALLSGSVANPIKRLDLLYVPADFKYTGSSISLYLRAIQSEVNEDASWMSPSELPLSVS
jgi:hypothetical protein